MCIEGAKTEDVALGAIKGKVVVVVGVVNGWRWPLWRGMERRCKEIVQYRRYQLIDYLLGPSNACMFMPS